MSQAAAVPLPKPGARRAAQRGRGKPPRFDVRRLPGFATMAWVCVIGLYAPIVVLVIYSFNDNPSVTIWTGFSWRWYASAFGNEQIRDAALLSLRVAVTAAIVATAFATMAALATTRVPSFRGLTAIYAIINQPLMVPEIVTGIATVVFFALIKQLTGIYGLGYLITAHIVFCIPFAYLPIRARLEDMDRAYEIAAADLYATPWRAFRYVTLPLLVPGILGGAMLAFLVSLDDVVITVLVSGPGEETLPLYVIGQVKRGVTPELNAMATLFLAASTLFATLFFLLTRKRAG
ncbi:MAG TPA: ABC transporter permease [Dongiaceae bacterium]|jgi:spermidine/putrescine transport system permease protein|nr:ABC transporter permease [Dongiaceae bacterium]